ncbi:hypothetical protein EC835_11416 [Providencia alcalifaciens]|uniref:Uncharacterized protein n=1 Tax=Providencia alcalifaciens TaxID=126385 RepID=A0A4R3NF30_9GAMM|nr:MULTISPECIES: hypothetical protein [Providencia]MBC5792303.1 hypothetical protein [Providencia sp. JUb39]TCT28885.1 hypothetical protein EC835_11416 [Providencia alcalifaciens]
MPIDNLFKTLIYSLRNQFNLIELISLNINALSDDDITIMMGNALQTINGLLSLYEEHKAFLSEEYKLELVIEDNDLIISTSLLPHRIICHLAYIELLQHRNSDVYTRHKNLMQQMGFIPQPIRNKLHYRVSSASYRFPKLVEALNGQVTKETIAKMNLILGDKNEVTSIRLRPKTRAVLHAYSDNLGISVSQIINIMIDGVIEQTFQYDFQQD